jgi:hypothetical protein
MSQQSRDNLISLAVALVVAIAVFCLAFFVGGKYNYTGWSNGFFVSGASLVCLALLRLATRFGTFDVLAYSFYRLFESFKPDGKKRYDTAYDYQEAQKTKRKERPVSYWPFFAVGGVLLLLGLLFAILANASITPASVSA